MSPGIEDCQVNDQASLKAWLASKTASATLTPQLIGSIVRLIDHAQALRTMILAAEDALWDWSIDDDQLYCSPQVWRALGCDASPCTQPMAFWRTLVHPDDLPLFRRALLAHWQQRTPKFELYFRARPTMSSGDEWLWAYVCGEVTGTDPKGRVTRMSGSLRNITSEMQLRELLRDREHQLRQTKDLTNSPLVFQMAPAV